MSYFKPEDLEYLKQKYISDNYITHYDECWKDHTGCAVAKLIDIIQAQAKEINKLSSYDYRSYAPQVWNWAEDRTMNSP